MPVDPQDGGLDDWIESAPALTRFLPSNAPVFDTQDGGVDDWVAPSGSGTTSGGQRAAMLGFDVQDSGPDDWIPHAPVIAPSAALSPQVNDPQDSGPDDWIPQATILAGPRQGFLARDLRDGGIDDWILHAPILVGPGQGFPATDPQDGGIDDWTLAASTNPVERQDTGATRTDPSDGGPDDWIAPWTQSAGQSWPAPAIGNQARSAPDLWRLQDSVRGPGQMAWWASSLSPNLSVPESEPTFDRLTPPRTLGLFGEFVDWQPLSKSQYGLANSALPWGSDASQFAFPNSDRIWPAPYQSGSYRSDGTIIGADSENTIPDPVLVSGELDGEDEEQKKLEAPAVAAGLIEPGLARPKRVPTLPSMPPVEVPLPEEAPGPSGRGVWDSPPTIRGRTLEQLFGHNLHPNYPTVDKWDPTSGTITSLKSVDLESPTYTAEGRYQGTLYNRLSKYVNDLAEFECTTYAENSISKDGIKARVLNVIVPGPGTATQQEVIRRIIGLGAQRGLTVTFTIY